MGSMRVHDNIFLVGLTGGIATGKTTVADMFEKLGARTIDFDVLSRLVVEPETPAWTEIVAHFGEQILLHDRTINRKAVSDIVFEDAGERKTLESIIHPRVGDEFARLVAEIATDEPDAVIQAVVPLLFETNMQHLFDKLVVVYAPDEVQIERLIERDGIDRKKAGIIAASQLPIDEKKRLADFVIDNSGALETTRDQVEHVWKQLKRLRTAKRV